MIRMKKMLAPLAVGAFLVSAMPAMANPNVNLYASCEGRGSDELVLRFQNARIYALQGAIRIPLKQIIERSCGIDSRRLTNIEGVVVKGDSFTQYSTLWLEGDGVRSYSQYLYAGRYGRGPNGRGVDPTEGVVFRLNGRTPGALKLLIQGDMMLEKIRVDFTRISQPPYGGPGGSYPPPPPYGGPGGSYPPPPPYGGPGGSYPPYGGGSGGPIIITPPGGGHGGWH
jgi:hypothetical protein